jgi:hypothetical protein
VLAAVRGRLLVDWCTFPPVGHAIEGLQVAGAYRAANPDLKVALLLNARTALDLASSCPWLSALYTVDLDLSADRIPDDAFADIPREWDWVHWGGYRGPWSFAQYPQFERLTARAVDHFRTRYAETPQRAREWRLRLELPSWAVQEANSRLRSSSGPILSVLPSGGGERWQYPSLESWQLLLRELRSGFPEATIVLLGKSTGHRPSGLVGDERDILLDTVAGVDAYDLPLLVQLAIVQRSGLLFSPHSGFGFAASTVDTPWLVLSGGPYPEYFHNGVPFHSLVPDTERFPALDDQTHRTLDDDGSGDREAAMTRSRIDSVLPALVPAARMLLSGTKSYEDCLADYFPALLRAMHGDLSKVGSWDDIHTRFLA